MVEAIEGMISDILRREGGYVNHVSDRGGPTNMGITQATLSGYLGRPASVSDVRKLTKDMAKKIYRERYYTSPGFHRLTAELQPFLFDSAVNHGPRRAVKLLQGVLNAAGFPCGPVDGAIGPQTLRAAGRACDAMGEWLLAALVEERRDFYRSIIRRDPSQAVFEKGWMARVDEFDVALPEVA